MKSLNQNSEGDTPRVECDTPRVKGDTPSVTYKVVLSHHTPSTAQVSGGNLLTNLRFYHRKKQHLYV